MTSAEEFTEFAAGAWPQLQRTAFLLCGDWHNAEDLAQATLAKVFVAWRRIKRHDALHAYATRTLVNTYLADKRLMRSGEVVEHPGFRAHLVLCSSSWLLAGDGS